LPRPPAAEQLRSQDVATNTRINGRARLVFDCDQWRRRSPSSAERQKGDTPSGGPHRVTDSTSPSVSLGGSLTLSEDNGVAKTARCSKHSTNTAELEVAGKCRAAEPISVRASRRSRVESGADARANQCMIGSPSSGIPTALCRKRARVAAEPRRREKSGM
jgi:hypothetical protein